MISVSKNCFSVHMGTWILIQDRLKIFWNCPLSLCNWSVHWSNRGYNGLHTAYLWLLKSFFCNYNSTYFFYQLMRLKRMVREVTVKAIRSKNRTISARISLWQRDLILSGSKCALRDSARVAEKMRRTTWKRKIACVIKKIWGKRSTGRRRSCC